jgi:hypothetical protein
LSLLGTAVLGNHHAGVYCLETEAEAFVTGSLIKATLPQPSDQDGGAGIVVRNAKLRIGDSAIVDNHDFGLLAREGKTKVIAAGILIEGTLPRESDGKFGVGALSIDGATLQLASSVVHDNNVSALLVVTATAAVSRSLIDVVAAGSLTLLDPATTFVNVGDGLLATLGSTLDITDTRVQGCVRAGVLFDDSTGTLSGVVSTENQFGLVLGGERRPSYEGGSEPSTGNMREGEVSSPNDPSPVPSLQGGGNQFSGNTAQDIVTAGERPVPDAPSPAP